MQPNFWSVDHESDVQANYRRLWKLQRQAWEASRTYSPDLLIMPETVIQTPPGPFSISPLWASPSTCIQPDPVHISYFPRELTYLEPSSVAPANSAEEELQRGDLPTQLAVQRGFQTPLLFGAFCHDHSGTLKGRIPGRLPLFNSALLLGAQGQVLGRADKQHLLPFGEYVPGGEAFPILYSWLPFGCLLAGPGSCSLPFRGAHLGVNICYEDTMPWRDRAGQPPPNILANISNDTWFGHTFEAEGHLGLAKARAIERRVYLIRCSTGGVSAVIDPLGRTVAHSQVDEECSLPAEVAFMPGQTLYSQIGDVLPWSALLWVTVLGLLRKRLGSRVQD